MVVCEKVALLLSLAGAVEEEGPLGAGLPAADPEHARDAHYQGHHVLDQEQSQVWTAALCRLGTKRPNTNGNILTGTMGPEVGACVCECVCIALTLA